MDVSLEQQVKCARRELAMRRGAYPRFVAHGKMKQAKADEEIAAMEAILATLERLEQAERLL